MVPLELCNAAFLSLGILSLTYSQPCIGRSSGVLGWHADQPEFWWIVQDTEPPFWGCGTDYPVGATIVAVGGFLVAAMWIDTIASELVGLLDYFGALLGIDHAILGLTILAWGNSIGDMVTDVAIARRGLPNMAITACFAGPVFNLLIALGLGFLRLIGADPDGQVSVKLSLLDVIGAAFLISMCVMVIITGIVNHGHLPRNTGFALIGLYVAYLVTSVAYVGFTNPEGS